MPALTKAQLSARVAELEVLNAQLRSELDALYVAQRPSRAAAPAVQQAPRTPELPFRERLRIAKEIAQRTGRAVRV